MPVSRVLPVCLILGITSAQGADLSYPTPDWEAGKAAVQRFAADYAQWEKDPQFFEAPAVSPPWPCEVPDDTLYPAVGLTMALPDGAARIAKMTRKAFREQGMDPDAASKATMKYDNIQIIPLRVTCKEGKIDGETDLLVSYDTRSEFNNTMPFKGRRVTTTTINRIRWTQRASPRFQAGTLIGNDRTIGRMYSSAESSYDDAEFGEMMKSANSASGIVAEMQKKPLYTFSYSGKGGFTSFSISQEPKITGGLFGVSANFQTKLRSTLMRSLGDGRDEMVMYDNAQLSQRSPMKNGKAHGDQITWMPNYLKASNLRLDQVPGMERAKIVTINGVEMIEKHMCFIEGVLTQTAECPSN